MALCGAGQMSACKACAGLCGFVCAGCWLVWPVSARVGLVLACVALMLVAWEAPTGAACCALVLACVASAGLRWPVWLVLA